MTLKGWAAVTVAICVGVLVVAAALETSDQRADNAEKATGEAKAVAKIEGVRATTNASVGEATAAQADAQVRVERRTVEVIRVVEASPDASTPISPDLARAWVAGLRRMCDDAGPDACAGRDDRP